jgi:hypothetical protein
MTSTRPFAAAIDRGLASGNLEEALRPFETLDDPEDARALVAAIDRMPVLDQGFGSPLGVVARAFQSAEGQGVLEVLSYEGLPKLHELYDRCLEALDAGEMVKRSDLLFVLKIYAMYASRGGLGRVIAAARDARLEDEFLWSIVFGIYAGKEHPLAGVFVEGLRDPLPSGFVAIAFLDACNTIARQERVAVHPFASAEGIARLEGWLGDADPEHFSYAHSAASALPFVGTDDRERLLGVAAAHPDPDVRLESAWADAVSGGEAGLARLVAACSDPHSARAAMEYLDELGQASRIPHESTDPAFRAMAEMSSWLQHPNELGRPPDKLELYDTRILDWPPTKDRRRLWLFRYESGDDVGFGLVGSITFSLFGEVTGELSAEDAYALHCCWELQMNGDPRAPAERSIAAGRALLGLLPN